jgi:hypothetical protein
MTMRCSSHESLELHRQVLISPGDVGWAACERDELLWLLEDVMYDHSTLLTCVAE